MRTTQELQRIARFLLRREPAGFGATALFSVGLAMIYGDDFILGIVFLALAGIWAIGAWLVSEELQKRKPQPPMKSKYEKIKKYRHARRGYLFWKWSIPAGIIGALMLSALFVDVKRQEKLLHEYQGVLRAANDPDPPSFCADIPGDAVKVFMGRNEGWGRQFPFTVLRVRGKDRIVIDRDRSGALALSTDIFDKEGRVVVTFEHGRFTVVQSNILDMKRPDRSTLIVRNQFKDEVLNVRYLNKHSVQFSGLLQYPEFGQLRIPKTVAVSGFCAGGSVGPDGSVIALD